MPLNLNDATSAVLQSEVCTISPVWSDIVIPIISIVVTAILSFLIWRANKASADLSGRLAVLEDQRDISAVRGNATSLYFSLLSCLDCLLFNYSQNETTRAHYCNQNWIENLSELSSYLSDDESYYLFNFFKDADQFTENNQVIADKCSEVFDNSVLEYIIQFPPKERIMARYALKLFPYHILIKLEKLHQATSSEDIKCAQKIGCDSIRTEKYRNGDLFYQINYRNGKVVHKKILAVNTGEIIEDCDYKSGRPTGQKVTFCKGEKIAEGIYHVGKLINGKRYHVYLDNNYEPPEDEPEDDDSDYPSYFDRYMKVVEVIDGVENKNYSYENIEYEYQT